MKHVTLWLLTGLLLGSWTAPRGAAAQPRYLTKNGYVSFFSASIMEDIEARSTQAAAVVDVRTGQLAFSIPIRSFVFKRTLMQEHFNENYMESEKYPKATFTGQLVDPSVTAALVDNGPAQNVDADGSLTLHGVTKRVLVSGTLQLRDGQLIVFAYFNVAPTDYAVDIPLLVRDHIAKSVSIRVNATCDPVVQPVVAKP